MVPPPVPLLPLTHPTMCCLQGEQSYTEHPYLCLLLSSNALPGSPLLCHDPYIPHHVLPEEGRARHRGLANIMWSCNAPPPPYCHSGTHTPPLSSPGLRRLRLHHGCQLHPPPSPLSSPGRLRLRHGHLPTQTSIISGLQHALKQGTPQPLCHAATGRSHSGGGGCPPSLGGRGTGVLDWWQAVVASDTLRWAGCGGM